MGEKKRNSDITLVVKFLTVVWKPEPYSWIPLMWESGFGTRARGSGHSVFNLKVGEGRYGGRQVSTEKGKTTSRRRGLGGEKLGDVKPF